MRLPGQSTALHHVREATRLAPGRPAIWLGLRTAAATAVPLVAARWLPPAAASWAPLAGFLVALVDKGGAYRTRAITMTSVALGGLGAVVLGSLIAGHGLVTAAAVAVGLAVCALAQAWGPAMVSVGNAIAIELLVAASLPCEPGEALQRGIGFAGGAAFALVLGLVVWPIRVYKPGRRAVAAVLAELGELARALAGAGVDDASWRDASVRRHRVVRDKIEEARAVLAATRSGHRGETGRGERLLAIVQLADQMFGILIGLEEAVDAGCGAEARVTVQRGAGLLADGLAELARNVMIERPPASVVPAWSATPAVGGTEVEQTLAVQALALLARAHVDRGLAAAVLASLGDDSEPLKTQLPEPDPRPTFGARLREAFDPEGVVLRHAVRVAVVVVVAMALARLLELPHRYWVTLTAFVLLQPHGAATRVRALQRVVGTLVGGVIAAAIPWAIQDPALLIVIVVVLAGVSASVVHLNYALYATFLTPTFVLLAEVHAREFHLVGARIANTAIGAGLVVIGSLLWPVRTVARFDDEIADADDAAARYLDEVIAAVLGRVPQPSASVVAYRRQFGVALNRAELALDHLIVERAPAAVTEPRMTQLVFLRRLGAAINAFGSTRSVAGYAAHQAALAAFGAAAASALRGLAVALRTATSPSPRASLAQVVDDPVVAARLDRIAGAIATLADATLRAVPRR